MTEVSFFPVNFLFESAIVKAENQSYKYVVIIAREGENFIYCRHEDRDTWEMPGGHIEKGETPIDAAKRELFEETGAIEFSIKPLFDYRTLQDSKSSDGVIFLADISLRGDLPQSEIAEVKLFGDMPKKLTYLEIQPLIFKRYKELY